MFHFDLVFHFSINNSIFASCSWWKSWKGTKAGRKYSTKKRHYGSIKVLLFRCMIVYPSNSNKRSSFCSNFVVDLIHISHWNVKSVVLVLNISSWRLNTSFLGWKEMFNLYIKSVKNLLMPVFFQENLACL